MAHQPFEVRVLADAAAVSRAAAEEFVRLAAEAARERGVFSVALSGGSTPKAAFALLASELADAVPWDRTHVFWGDERHVGPDDAESNYRMANEAMLSKVPLPPENVHRILAEKPAAADAADAYARELEAFFGPGAAPRFDLVLLGMGPDGHTASLFPGTAALSETARTVVANHVPKLDTDRITLTAPVINAAREVRFLVAGDDKAEALHAVLDGPPEATTYPSQLVRPVEGHLVWIVDRAAARLLVRERGTVVEE